MSKKRYEAGKILTKIIAGILAAMMLFAVAATLAYYLIVF